MPRLLAHIAIALTTSGWIGGASLHAQDPADEVLFAAARDLTGPERGNRIGIDPREVKRVQFPGSGVYVGLRARERTRALAERLGGQVVSRDTAVRCDPGPPQCTLGNFDVVVALSEPVISGDTATVHATVSSVYGPKADRVGTRDVVLTLIRSVSGWRVLAERITRIT